MTASGIQVMKAAQPPPAPLADLVGRKPAKRRKRGKRRRAARE